MNKQPEVSVIIPTYNRYLSLVRAMQSVARQSFKDWEMIIIDDCSTDTTMAVIQRWIDNGWPIRSCKLEVNSGSPVAPRNCGVKMAKGEYIAFLDSDDFWYPNKLETQLWYMKYHGSNFSYHDLTVRRNDDNYQWSKMSTCHSDNVFKFLLRKNFIPTSTVMMKRWLYERHGGMEPELTINHDWDLWLRIASEHGIHFVNEQLGELEIHDGSVISKVHQRRKDCRKIIRKWKWYVDRKYYRKVMAYYYAMEVFDVLPERIQKIIRKWWYKQSRYKG